MSTTEEDLDKSAADDAVDELSDDVLDTEAGDGPDTAEIDAIDAALVDSIDKYSRDVATADLDDDGEDVSGEIDMTGDIEIDDHTADGAADDTTHDAPDDTPDDAAELGIASAADFAAAEAETLAEAAGQDLAEFDVVDADRNDEVDVGADAHVQFADAEAALGTVAHESDPDASAEIVELAELAAAEDLLHQAHTGADTGDKLDDLGPAGELDELDDLGPAGELDELGELDGLGELDEGEAALDDARSDDNASDVAVDDDVHDESQVDESQVGENQVDENLLDEGVGDGALLTAHEHAEGDLADDVPGDVPGDEAGVVPGIDDPVDELVVDRTDADEAEQDDDASRPILSPASPSIIEELRRADIDGPVVDLAPQDDTTGGTRRRPKKPLDYDPAPVPVPLKVPRILGRKPRVRKVTRVVRHVDPWTVFKVALLANLVLYVIVLTASVLLWNVAYATGTIENVERFFESFGWQTFEFNGGELYNAAWIAGLFIVLGLTGLWVLLATLFNLITDVVGGVRFTVLEEEVVEARTSPMRRFVVRRAEPEVPAVIPDASGPIVREAVVDDTGSRTV